MSHPTSNPLAAAAVSPTVTPLESLNLIQVPNTSNQRPRTRSQVLATANVVPLAPSTLAVSALPSPTPLNIANPFLSYENTLSMRTTDFRTIPNFGSGQRIRHTQEITNAGNRASLRGNEANASPSTTTTTRRRSVASSSREDTRRQRLRATYDAAIHRPNTRSRSRIANTQNQVTSNQSQRPSGEQALHYFLRRSQINRGRERPQEARRSDEIPVRNTFSPFMTHWEYAYYRPSVTMRNMFMFNTFPDLIAVANDVEPAPDESAVRIFEYLDSLWDPRGLDEAQRKRVMPTAIVYTATLQRLDNDRCSICQAERVKGDSIVELRCTHRFHESCADQMLTNDSRCAVCRYDYAHMAGIVRY